jgi:hypothetical protein
MLAGSVMFKGLLCFVLLCESSALSPLLSPAPVDTLNYSEFSFFPNCPNEVFPWSEVVLTATSGIGGLIFLGYWIYVGVALWRDSYIVRHRYGTLSRWFNFKKTRRYKLFSGMIILLSISMVLLNVGTLVHRIYYSSARMPFDIFFAVAFLILNVFPVFLVFPNDLIFHDETQSLCRPFRCISNLWSCVLHNCGGLSLGIIIPGAHGLNYVLLLCVYRSSKWTNVVAIVISFAAMVSMILFQLCVQLIHRCCSMRGGTLRDDLHSMYVTIFIGDADKENSLLSIDPSKIVDQDDPYIIWLGRELPRRDQALRLSLISLEYAAILVSVLLNILLILKKVTCSPEL